MFHFLVIPVALTTLLAADGKHYEFKTGSDLIRLCGSKQLADIRECIGYVQGVADLLEDIRKIRHDEICTPPSFKAEEFVQEALYYLKSHPEATELGAEESVLAVLDSLNDNWCDALHGRK